MAAEKINSYTEVVADAARDATTRAERDRQYGAMCLDDNARRAWESHSRLALRHAAALRELAGLLTELQRGRGMVPDEREALEYRVVAALRAGYRPEGVEG